MARSRFLPCISSWKTYGRMFTKARLWTPAVRHVLAKHGLPFGRIGGTYPGTCAVFRVTGPQGDLLVKFFPPDFAGLAVAGDQHLEYAALRAVVQRGGIPVPLPLAVGTLRDRSTWGYLILRRLRGRPIREVWRRMPHTDRLQAMRTIGTYLRRLHAIPAPAGVPPLNMSALVHKALRNYREAGVFSPALMADLRRRLPLLTSSGHRKRRTFLHADLSVDHAIVIRRAGRWRVRGLIDFADATAGDPFYEEMPLRFGFDWKHPVYFYAAMRRCHPSLRWTPRNRDRGAAFLLTHEFTPGAVLRELKQGRVRTKSLTWPTLRDWLLPPDRATTARPARNRHV